jgi:hypothetical protein
VQRGGAPPSVTHSGHSTRAGSVRQVTGLRLNSSMPTRSRGEWGHAAEEVNGDVQSARAQAVRAGSRAGAEREAAHPLHLVPKVRVKVRVRVRVRFRVRVRVRVTERWRTPSTSSASGSRIASSCAPATAYA